MAKRTVNNIPKSPGRDVRQPVPATQANKLVSNERTSQECEFDCWTRAIEGLHARMQSPGARQAVDALFSATEVELNRRDK